MKKRRLRRGYKPLLATGMLIFYLSIPSATAMDSQNFPLKTTFMSAVELIEEQTGYKFFFSNELVDTDQEITLTDFTERDIDSVVKDLLNNPDLTYSIVGNNIVVKKAVEQPILTNNNQQQRNIKGTVKDDSGLELIGVSIKIKETSQGTITNMNGEFQLSIPNNATHLEVSYVGYITQHVDIKNKNDINVILKEDKQALDEVVVTALGIKREEKALGYSVQKVGSEAISSVKGIDVASSLTGKVAGLSINNSSEISEKPEIKLRGSNPLIVIDGVPYVSMSLNDLGAEDIESIDILKGATASALYGVRGRDGAIMVTTKKGEEGKLTVNASNNTMFSAGYLKMPKKQNAYSTGNYGQLEYSSGFVWGDYMGGQDVNQYDPITKEMKVMPLLPRGKNNISNFLETSLTTNSNINISQSGKLGSFRLSATQVHHKGQVPKTKIDKYIINGSGSIKWNKLKLDASFSYKKEKAPNFPAVNYGNGNLLYNMLIWSGTEFNVKDYRDYWKIKNQKQNWPFEDAVDNPYFIANEKITKWDKNHFSFSLNLSYDILDNLSVMFRSGFENYSDDQENRRSIGDSSDKRGYYGYNNFIGSSFNNDLMINGNHKFKDFSFDYLFGMSSLWFEDRSLYSNTRGGLSIPGFYSLNASVERPAVSKSIQQKALYGIYGKLSLAWKSALYIDATGRNDWSSTLPSDSRSYFYPSVSTSFLPSSLYNPIENILDFWKIRFSWTMSKKDLGIYDINRAYSVTPDRWAGQTSATYPSNLRDPSAKPEQDISFEIGTDFRFFSGRLGLDITYFNRLRKDRLVEATVSPSSGFNRIITNTQEQLRQKGMEFTITGTPINTKDFTWDTQFNGSFWHWYYDKLDPIYSSKDPRKAKGERIDKFFMYDWEKDHSGNIVHRAGLPVRNNYQTVMGNSDPSFILGFSNNFKYKDFSLNLSFDGRIGGLMYSWTEQALWNSGSHPDSDNQWRYDEVVNKKQNYIGEGVTVVSGSAEYDPFGNVISDTREFMPNTQEVSYQTYITSYNKNAWDHQARQNIRKGTFIKLREVALNYNVPQRYLQNTAIQSVRLGIIGQNLLLWTKEFKFSDPDRGRENLNTPTMRYIGFNVNITL